MTASAVFEISPYFAPALPLRICTPLLSLLATFHIHASPSLSSNNPGHHHHRIPECLPPLPPNLPALFPVVQGSPVVRSAVDPLEEDAETAVVRHAALPPITEEGHVAGMIPLSGDKPYRRYVLNASICGTANS